MSFGDRAGDGEDEHPRAFAAARLKIPIGGGPGGSGGFQTAAAAGGGMPTVAGRF